MIELELNEEAFDEVRSKCIAAGLIVDEPWYEDAKPFTVGGITFKQWKYIQTPEDIERQRRFAESPLGKISAEMFKRSSEKLAAMILEDKKGIFGDHVGVLWGKIAIRPELRIKLPNDYVSTDHVTHEQTK